MNKTKLNIFIDFNLSTIKFNNFLGNGYLQNDILKRSAFLIVAGYDRFEGFREVKIYLTNDFRLDFVNGKDLILTFKNNRDLLKDLDIIKNSLCYFDTKIYRCDQLEDFN